MKIAPNVPREIVGLPWGWLGAGLGLGWGLLSNFEKSQIIVLQHIKQRNKRNYLIPKYHSPKPAAGLVLACSCVGAGVAPALLLARFFAVK